MFTARCTIMQSAILRLHVVCPSVTVVDCDHTCLKSWKLIAQTISPTPSLFIAQRPSTQGNVGKFGGLEVRWEKVACWSTKAAISLETRKDREKVTMQGLTLKRSFERYYCKTCVVDSECVSGASACSDQSCCP